MTYRHDSGFSAVELLIAVAIVGALAAMSVPISGGLIDDIRLRGDAQGLSSAVFGMVANTPREPFPDGFGARPGPFGVSFTGLDCSEPRLIEIAFAFEQATKRRVPPATAP